MTRWAYRALDGAVIVAYPLLMVVAVRSVQVNDDGLRVLWPAVVTLLPAVLVGRRPVTALLLILVGTVFGFTVIGAGDSAFGLRLITAFGVGAVAAARRTRVGVAAAAVAWVALVGGEMSGWMIATGEPVMERVQDALSAALLTFDALLVAVGLTVGLLLRQRREHAGAIRARAAEQAITEERLRIARELHDSVAHRVGVIALQAGAANRVFETQPARARQAIGVVENSSREALAELRRMVGGLRSADGAMPGAGLAGLPDLVAATAEAGVQVEVLWLPTDLPADIDRSAFRIVQEAVTNVVRHAGVQACRVTIEQDAEMLTIEVTDEGRGGTGVPGHGLAGMRERVSLLHGEFEAGPRPEGGFRVFARLPVAA
ncbi:Nitrate/nitrite sensor protein narQ [Actinoplanes sp. SE50]|uniref:sensor histidine kinase n=1 Tax=unclassified Actinoplanes TaxID=2626549 RepID=UPI00023EC7E9|nr:MULTISPECIES: sensor histidine kinase [unclassified Actinoplanes]AEV84745.1 Nitrate/nitrite sensor protein narQ [Actinoplanes sp. SE50/110]ATO83137.1 Nitrate/nitrite sensor protein narQ [Actinoplanes sp. SE50]SLM00544.1 two-component system sensor kinase [Actinoplanes sp. SE50/110]